MNHLTTLTWLQWILIEAGALLQIAAIVALIKQKSEHRILPQHASHHVTETDTDEMAPDRVPKQDPAHEYRDPASFSRSDTTLMPVRDLTRTTKVPFKQTFKFR